MNAQEIRAERSASRWERRFNRRARRAARAVFGRSGFGRNTDGSTAVEFALVALPFFGLIFAILEMALVFFTGSVLAHAVSDTGRTVRVGQFQGCGGVAEFKQLICARMHNLMGCEDNLRVDLVTSTGFRSISMPNAGLSGLDQPGPGGGDPEIDDGTYTDTSAGDPVGLRAIFYYPLVLPPQLTRLESIDGSGRHVLVFSTAFRNEPFPDNATCDPDISAELNGTTT